MSIILKTLNIICNLKNYWEEDYLEEKIHIFIRKHHIDYDYMLNLIDKYEVEIVNSMNKKKFDNNYRFKINYLFVILENKCSAEYRKYMCNLY